CGILCPKPNFTQEKTGSSEPKMTPEDAAKKNPITPSPEGLAEARKQYGYDCAMCHGKDGGGKGDLAQDMKLELHDWRDPSTIEKMTDGELFWVISYGRGKMVGGEADRDRKSTRLNSSHDQTSYAVFCLTKKTRGPHALLALRSRPSEARFTTLTLSLNSDGVTQRASASIFQG